MALETEVRKLYASIGKLITSSLELEDILEGVMKEVKTFFNPENWSLMRLDKETNELFFSIVKGINVETLKDVTLKMGEGIAGTVAKTGKAIFVPNVETDPRFSKKADDNSGFHTESIIAVPLIFRDEVYGVLEILNRSGGGSFTEEELLVLQTLADFAAIAFANSALYEQTMILAHTDNLTGVFNRTKLNHFIEEKVTEYELRRRQGDDSLVTVVSIDLNDFKIINDRFGHQEGDKVLKKTARALLNCIRNNDLVFRVGGDEFLLLINCPNLEKAELAKERVIAQLKELTSSDTMSSSGAAFSFGVATGGYHEIRKLMHEADLNMYKLKQETKI